MSTTENLFCSGPAASFFLKLLVTALLLHQLHIAHLPIWGGSSSSVILFYLFTLFMGFSKQEYWNGLLFPLSVNHIFSDLFPVTCPSWVALQGMAHSFTELCKPRCHEKAVIHERSPIITLYQA